MPSVSPSYLYIIPMSPLVTICMEILSYPDGNNNGHFKKFHSTKNCNEFPKTEADEFILYANSVLRKQQHYSLLLYSPLTEIFIHQAGP